MRRVLLCVSLLVPIAAVGCGGPRTDELADTSSALMTVMNGIRGYTRSDGVHAIVYRSPTRALQEYAENPFGSGIVTRLGGVPAYGPPWGYTRADSVDAVVYFDVNAHLHELARAGATWVDTDFATTASIAAPTAQVVSGIVVPEAFAYVRTNNSSAIVYRNLNAHITQVSTGISSSPPWVVNDLTAATAAPSVAGVGPPVPYIRSDNRNAIVFIASDNHVHELVSDFGNPLNWTHSDLSLASGETVLVNSNITIWAYKRSDNVNAVVFVGRDGRIHELSMDPSRGQSWSTTILFAASAIHANSRLTAYARADGINAVVYEHLTGSVVSLHEVRVESPDITVDVTLPTVSGATPAVPFAHRAPGNRSSVLYAATTASMDVVGAELSLPSGSSTWESQTF